jgi:hypothetical protein
MTIEYREALDDAAEYCRNAMTHEQTRALACANWSLHYGSGGGCEYGFEDACAILTAWAESVEDVRETVEHESEDEDGDLITWEETETIVEARAIVRAIVGEELAPYL